MENSNEKSGFSYTYSASEQAEIRSIREKYAPSTEKEDKMERIRRLDTRVTERAQVAALVLGIIGALILGFGMSLIMTDFSEILGIGETMAMVIGIFVGIVGGILASLAYPIYNAIVKVKRKKLAPEIIRLTDELMK